MESSSSPSLSVVLQSRDELPARRTEIHDWLARRASGRALDDLVLACGEAVDNSVEHGTPPVTVDVSCSDGVLAMTVRDVGTWNVSARAPTRGLGLPLMTALMDTVSIDTTAGTAIRLTCRL